MDKRKKKKIIGITTVAMGATFVGLTYFAKKQKPNSIFENDLNQKNPLEGKRVIFVEDEKDKENADGIKGHLVEIGDSLYRPSFYEKYIKRGMDVLLSFGGLVVLSPVMGTIALAIKLEDPGPVLFTQKRLGQNKQYFKLHKFRSMKMSTPHDVPTHMLDNPDQYITKVGKFIRAHSLDELPQIWDIFIGNMSVIGPRPGLWNQDLLTAERDKYSANDVKPGLTGWAQINGRDELEIPDKAKLDGEYVKHLGPKMDTKIFLDSLHVFSKDESVVEGGTGEMKKTSVGRHYTDGKSKEDLIGSIGFGQPVEVDTTQHKKILITGKGSYIGETFKEYANHHYLDNFEIDTLDMLDPTWKETDFSNYDVVYHVAGIAHADVGNVSDETKEKYYKVNTDLALEVCQKAKQDHVKEFIFMSSMIVYGDSAPYGQEKIIDKDTVPNPANFYGDSKLQADVAIRELADDDFKVLVLRPPMIYGKGSKGNYPTLAKLAKKLPIFPDVENQRSMLYIENLCEFLCQVMLVKTINRNSIVLFPQNKEYTNTADMVKEIANASNHNIFESKLFNPVVVLGNKVPGKVSGLVNKAFGNNCYDKVLSQYEGIEYQIFSYRESIMKMETNMNKYNIDNLENRYNVQELQQGEINVFIIGLRGYTQNYGGWETFAHGLIDNWTDSSVRFFAFEKIDDKSKEEIVELNNITCIRVFEEDTGSSTMMKYDKKCTDLTCDFVKHFDIQNPVMFHLGLRVGPYLWLKRNQIKDLGITMMENPAGVEWKRTKWNKLVQVYLFISALMMAKSTDYMCCDNEGVREVYRDLLYGKKPKLEYVAYGVEAAQPVDKNMPVKVRDFFNQWGLEKDGYYLILGRFIPENNYELMFKGFKKSKTKRKLLVICNYKTEIKKFYDHIKKATQFEQDNRIIMAGTLYDHEILHYIRQYAHGYIHGHSVGGTNPGLLEAMAETDINILYNVPFNRYVGGDAAYYFTTENELAEQIEVVDSISIEKKIEVGKLAKQRMKDKYTWKHIVDEYDRIFHDIL